MARQLRASVRTAAIASAAVHYLPSVAILGQWTRLQRLPGGICRWQGPRFPPRVALTFDDGPHPKATPAVLDRLEELGLRATFFPLGALAERDPDAIHEIARRGHGIGTHGYAHDRHLLRSPRWVRRDLDAAANVMAGLRHQPTWYRPTYGQLTGATLAAARANGWRTVLWSAWGREWATTDPVEVARRITRRLWPGSVVLLHDNDAFGSPGMWRVALDALEIVAAELERRGLESVTLDELVA